MPYTPTLPDLTVTLKSSFGTTTDHLSCDIVCTILRSSSSSSSSDDEVLEPFAINEDVLTELIKTTGSQKYLNVRLVLNEKEARDSDGNESDFANYGDMCICCQFLADIACRSDTERAPTSVFLVKNCHAAKEEEVEGHRNSDCCCCC